MTPVQPVAVGPYAVGGGNPLLWVCGPCVIEGRDITLRIADTLRGYAALGISHVQLVLDPNTAEAIEAMAPVLELLDGR